MSVRDLIDAIASGDSQATQSAFDAEMLSRVASRMETMRLDVAKNMFKAEQAVSEETELAEEAIKPASSNHIHVQRVENNKYKVHAVGKNFADGIKVGEHLSDSELDDFQEMGGKIKHVK